MTLMTEVDYAKTLDLETAHTLSMVQGYNLPISTPYNSPRNLHVAGKFELEMAPLLNPCHSPRPQLPPELMLHVFEFRVFGADISYPNDKGWIHQSWIAEISHVCSRWRALALAHPRLWTNIQNFIHLPVAEAMLSRSGSRPLNVRIYIPPHGAANLDRFRPVFTKLWSNLARIRALTFSGSPPAVEWMRQPGQPPLEVGSLAEVPQTGSVLVPPKILESFEAITDNRITLNECFLGTCAPALRSIRLVNCNFTWDKQVYPRSFSRLTSLSIKAYPDPSVHVVASVVVLTGPPFTISTLFSVLSTLSLLENLEMGHAIRLARRSDLTWVQTNRPVRLPNLKRLHLAASRSVCSIILGHLDIPTDTHLKLAVASPHSEIDLDQRYAEGCRSLMRTLIPRFDYLKSPCTLGLYLRLCRDGLEYQRRGPPLTIGVGPPIVRYGYQERFNTFPFEISLEHELSTIGIVLEAFDHSCVDLTVDVVMPRINTTLWKFLSTLPNLSKLRLFDVDWGSRWMNSRDDRLHFSQIASEHWNYFRSLKTIVVQDTLFSWNRLWWYPSFQNTPLTMNADPNLAPSFNWLGQVYNVQTSDEDRLIRFLQQRAPSLKLRLINNEGLERDLYEHEYQAIMPIPQYGPEWYPSTTLEHASLW